MAFLLCDEHSFVPTEQGHDLYSAPCVTLVRYRGSSRLSLALPGRRSFPHQTPSSPVAGESAVVDSPACLLRVARATVRPCYTARMPRPAAAALAAGGLGSCRRSARIHPGGLRIGWIREGPNLQECCYFRACCALCASLKDEL